MTFVDSHSLIVLIVAMLFLLGMATFIAGVLILTLRAANGDVKALAVQTTQLVQKGPAEEMVGLIGNATDLLDAMNQLVLTTRGIGIFLTIMGLGIMAFACYLAIQVYRMG